LALGWLLALGVAYHPMVVAYVVADHKKREEKMEVKVLEWVVVVFGRVGFWKENEIAKLKEVKMMVYCRLK